VIVRQSQTRPWIVSDDLWARIEPLLPQVQRRTRYPGRRRLPDRQVMCGILFVLYTAIPWEFLPQELGFGSGMTCWRRLAEWQQAGSGNGYTSCCSPSYTPPTGSTGPRRWSTAPTYER
jgi:hypothetical protein